VLLVNGRVVAKAFRLFLLEGFALPLSPDLKLAATLELVVDGSWF
jgi:hypothetical protein